MPYVEKGTYFFLMGKEMNKVQTCGFKRIPCLRMKQGHTHTHTHTHTSVHMHTHADPKDEETAIANKAAKPYSLPLHYKHIGAHSHFCFELVCVHGVTDSIDMSLSKLWEIVNDMEDWSAAVHGVTKT